MSTTLRNRRLLSDRDADAEPRRGRPTLDPRRVVVIVAVAVLVLVGGATAAVFSSTQRTRAAVDHVSTAIDPPTNHLLTLERALVNGQDSLNAAVGATGGARAKFLAQAVGYSGDVASAWTKYKAVAAALPGERGLAAKYVADQKRSSKAATAALVPILNAKGAATLPPAEIAAARIVRVDLVRLHSLYQQAGRRKLGDIADDAARFGLLAAGAAAGAVLMVVAGTLVGLRRARRIVAERSQRRAASRLTTFEGRLRRALELVHTDASAFLVGERATREMLPEGGISLLVADSSRARLLPVADPPACGVTTPDDCPSLRTGSSVRFADSRSLDACPVLAAHTDQPCSATCVPVAITGRGAAIMHITGPPGAPPDDLGVAGLVARGVGDRVTLLQALATYQLQAARDPLTGLLNRRSLETAVTQLLASTKQYAVAFGDLDHFKQLNDLHGHEAGDRALRAFARTLRDSLRPQDIACRWGGEEFVVVLPECRTAAAVEAMDRVRTNLALRAIEGNTAAVTVSFGVAHSHDAESFDEVVQRADAALRRAKDGGRNRVVSDEPAALPTGQPTLVAGSVP